jgi:hypothetical protein
MARPPGPGGVGTKGMEEPMENPPRLRPNSGPISRGVHLLFRKTAKGLDTINARTAQQTQRIDRQSNRLEQLQQKNQKKTAIDSNERFADIAKIKEAQTAMAAQTEA